MKIGFIRNFVSCVTKKYFKFSGRASREEHWKFIAVIIGIALILSFLQVLLMSTQFLEIIRIFSTIWSFFLFIPHFAVATRRLHDTNHSGWILIIQIIVGISGFVISFFYMNFIIISLIIYILLLLYLFYLFIKKGDPEPNKYGEN